jgi:putative membrane protein
MRFGFDSVPWITAAALAASTGRLVDEFIRKEGVGSAYLNLPFGAVAVGMVVRGITAYFLTRSGVFQRTMIPAFEVGPLSIEAIPLSARAALAIYLVAGVLVSLVGVQFAAYVSGRNVEAELFEQG